MDRKGLFMEAKQLQEILAKHLLWLNGMPSGERANLRGADLTVANLTGANLRGADLTVANLTGANLRGADLTGANLTGAYLRGANLRGAYLYRAYLTGANLTYANLADANLRGANLTGANLTYANLADANLRGANLTGTIAIPPMVCPETGSFIGYKKAISTEDPELCIVTLEIPADAKRSSATSRKCRCSKAKVLSIEKCDGSECLPVAQSRFDPSTYYRVGETVEVLDFEEDRWCECSAGIHFFMTKQEALEYML